VIVEALPVFYGVTSEGWSPVRNRFRHSRARDDPDMTAPSER